MDEPLSPARVHPHPSRLSPEHPRYAEIVECHASAVARGEDSYFEPGTGLFVMTARYLWNRGTCCDEGCRHCPFLVDEPD